MSPSPRVRRAPWRNAGNARKRDTGLVDGQHLVSNAFAAKRTAPLLISGAVIHVLPTGSQFDLTSRSLLAHQTFVPDPEVVEARAAEADLREVARDIAAEGVSPTNYARRLRRNRSR